MIEKIEVCPVCGGRLVYFIGDSKVQAVECVSGCDISTEQRDALINAYPIEEMLADVAESVSFYSALRKSDN